MFLLKEVGIFQLCLCSYLLLSHGALSHFEISSKALELMSKHRLIDGHNDFALQIRIHHNNKLSRFNIYNSNKTHTDINRLKAAHVGGQGLERGNRRHLAVINHAGFHPDCTLGVYVQMFAAYVICTAQDKDAVRLTLEQVDLIHRMCTEYPELELVTTAEELRNTKKIGCLISVEGGHSIDSSLPALRMFYQLGVRSMSLTHTCNTPWAETSSDLYSFYKRKNNSLTHFGKAVVDEMNRLGMLIDLSHTSWATSHAVLKYSKAPVIFSHSSSYAICNSARNVPDYLLQELKENKGLIMVNLHRGFIACDGKADVAAVANHFDHLKKVIGAQHIGIGGDYDGAKGFPEGMEDVSKYPALIDELLQRNWNETELAGILRHNFLRVFDEVEKVRDSLRSRPPSEEEIPFEEATNPCRVILRPPKIPSTSSVRSSSALLSVSTLFWAVFSLQCILIC